MSLHKMWDIWVYFPEIAVMPKYPYDRYKSTLSGSGTRVKYNLMWNLELKNFGLLFMCHLTWFGVFGPCFPKLPKCSNTCTTDLTQLSEIPWNQSKTWYDMNYGAEDFGLPFVCLFKWFGVFAPTFSKLLQPPNNCQTFINLHSFEDLI